MSEHYPFELPPIPYDESALEPYIDTETVKIHYYKHYKGYIDNLNTILGSYPHLQNLTLEQLLGNIDKLPAKIRTDVKNNAGGVYNHELYFNAMSPTDNEPHGALFTAIVNAFGSYDAFRQLFTFAGTRQFGSGWVWLAVDRYRRLRVVTTDNQNTLIGTGLYPVLLADVWEHAYYLKYRNRRREHLEAWFNVIDWEEAEKKYLNIRKQLK